MSDKPGPPKKGLEEPEAAYLPEEEEMSDAEIDAWFERNADAINASCDEAEAQIARGECYTLEEVMARTRATIERVAKKR